MTYGVFGKIFSTQAIIFYSMYFTAIMVAIMIPMKIMLRNVITFKLLFFSYGILYIFFYISAIFLAQLFAYVIYISGYLVLFGLFFLFSLFNIYILGKDLGIQFLITTVIFAGSIWIYGIQFLSIWIFTQLGWPILETFVGLMLLFVPVMLLIDRYILKVWAQVNVSKTIVLTITYVLFFAMNNLINLMVVCYTYEPLRILVSDAYFPMDFVRKLSPEAVFIVGDVNQELLLTVFFIVVCLLPIIYFIRLLIREVLGQKKILEQEQRAKELYSYIHIIESFNDELRKIQHDYKNILATLGGYIYNEEVDVVGLRKHYEEVMVSLDVKKFEFIHFSKIKNINNLEIVSILLSKIVKANEADIPLTLEILEPVDFQQEGLVKIARILGILLDNAIEGALECEEPKISIALVNMDERTVGIHIQNNTTNKQLFQKLMTRNTHYSTKGRNRGLGLGIVNELVESSEQLSLDFQQEEDIISFSLLVTHDKEKKW